MDVGGKSKGKSPKVRFSFVGRSYKLAGINRMERVIEMSESLRSWPSGVDMMIRLCNVKELLDI